MRRAATIAAGLMLCATASAQWLTFAGNSQHTALSPVPTLALDAIRWSTTVDETLPAPPILVHYGSPLITAANNVIIPVRTGTNAFRLEAREGATGSLLWSAPTDFRTAPSADSAWLPTFSPGIATNGHLYFPGAGGTIYRISDPNSTIAAAAPVRLSFLPDYAANKAAYDASVFVSTPITSDNAGNIYFGFQTTAAAPGGLTSGIARIAPNGAATYTSANLASGISGVTDFRPALNSAPALSPDGTRLYLALNGSSDYLVSLDPMTLAPQGRRALTKGIIRDAATSSPTVGPDGRVYFGVWQQQNHYRGMLEQFSADLSQSFAPGSFGWDITASIIPAELVPSYLGTSSYLVLTKYNDYAGLYAGGSGDNRMAILDPNDTQIDPISGQTVMREVLTISGVTPDPNLPGVREWCINTAAVDPFTKSILVNSADGKLYRWDLTTNRFSQTIELQSTGVFEAYTPTAIGPDGAVYAINRSQLFSVVPEPGSGLLLMVAAYAAGMQRVRTRLIGRS